MKIKIFVFLSFCGLPIHAAINGTGTQSVNLDTNLSRIETSTFTFATWVRLNAAQTAREFITCAGAGTVMGYGMGIDDTTSNKIKFYTANNAGSSHNLVSNRALQSNEWHHVTFIYKADASGATNKWIYVDGVLDNTAATTIQIGYNSVSCGLMTYRATGTQFLNGSLDDSRFYNRALTPAEVNTLALSHRRAPCTIDDGCGAYWKLDEGPFGLVQTSAGGTTIKDYSGNGVHGTPQNVIYGKSMLQIP